jgi:hypothetical protein
VHEFLAVVTHPRIYRPPSTPEEALGQIDAWSESRGLVFLSEGLDHRARMRGLLESSRVTGPRIHDARIAAVCMSHGVQVLWTVDRDFSRFPALRVENPLAS